MRSPLENRTSVDRVKTGDRTLIFILLLHAIASNTLLQAIALLMTGLKQAMSKTGYTYT
ncbi:hypothetical protein ACEYW6_24250 [Nostoc sp. UIC 10607]|uniref:hypothetical protein n=1 Tax=Nostoc sp. UIC 10607 TaxID=3045935 RepID=UPI0039A10841